MKRHNEGYALPFVLVVLVVMCIIAVGIMDFSLRNLQSQKATIQRIEAKYEAAGKIEEIVAAIENGEKVYSFPRTSQLDFAIIPISDTEKYVRIVSCSQNDEEQTLWVIAELKVPVSQWAPDEVNGALTISEKSTATYLWYEIVDSDTAGAFLDGDYPGNGGNGQ